MSAENTEDLNKECLICSYSLKQRLYIAVIPCSCSNINVCAICALRLRIFDKNRSCPFCKASWKTLLVSSKKYDCRFKDIDLSKKVFDFNIDVYFENEKDLLFFKTLRSYHCVICKLQNKKQTDFKNMISLAEHLKKNHNRYFCEICAGNQKLFPYEFEIYNKFELNTHKKKGLFISPSKPQMEPHPQCKFCKEVCFDLDALYLHLEGKHIMCQFCRSQGKHVYEANIEGMTNHYRKEHFLCEAPECIAQRFVVFDNAIDLNDHHIRFHGKQMSKDEIKQKSIITRYTNFGNLVDQPTQFSINRQNTRNNYFSDKNETRPKPIINPITFPELPKSNKTAPSTKPKSASSNKPKQTYAEKVTNRARTVPLPPLPTSNKSKTEKQFQIKPPRKQREKKVDDDKLLDQIIAEGSAKKSARPPTKQKNDQRNQKKKNAKKK